MKLFGTLIAVAVAQNEAYSMFDPSTSDYEYNNYNPNFIQQTGEETRASFGGGIKELRGSCMLCNVEGATGGEAYKKCVAQAKFVRLCEDENANPQGTHEPNVCMVEERRNNGRTQLNIRCQEKQAGQFDSLRDQKQNKRQCTVQGAKDGNGIEKASTCRKCHNYGKAALRTIQQGKRNDLRYSRWFE